MQKVIDYKLVTEVAPLSLEARVKESMGEGWVPSGTTIPYKDMLVQAMVKFEDA